LLGKKSAAAKSGIGFFVRGDKFIRKRALPKGWKIENFLLYKILYFEIFTFQGARRTTTFSR
jgi:hypothetical protein